MKTATEVSAELQSAVWRQEMREALRAGAEALMQRGHVRTCETYHYRPEGALCTCGYREHALRLQEAAERIPA